MRQLPCRRPRVSWREALTKAERAELAAIERAKAKWLQLNRSRAGIVNRAMTRRRNRPRVGWRDLLTKAERAELAAIERAKAAWQRLNLERIGIVNRAVKRASYQPVVIDRRRRQEHTGAHEQ